MLRFLCVLLASITLVSNAYAASEKEFAKCQKFLGKRVADLVAKADKAKLKHDKTIDKLISTHAQNSANPEMEAPRLLALAEKTAALYHLPDYRNAYIDEVVENALAIENHEKFSCPTKWYINFNYKRYIDTYSNRLDAVSRAIEERLDLENIGPNEGLVVILFYASSNAENVEINRLGGIGGNIDFGPVTTGDYFRVRKVKAGSYRWDKVWNRTWNGRISMYLKNQEHDFTVEAGKLNYTGVFVFDNSSSMRWRADVRDRTSVVLTLLEHRYPELLKKLELYNGLDGDSRFIDYYFEQKASATLGDDDA